MHPLIPPAAIAVICAVSAGNTRAAGVAVLKEQVFHNDASARPVVYTRIIDSNGPYLRIVHGGTKLDILRSKLVARVELPDAIPAMIREEKDIASLRVTLAALREFTTRYPKSLPFLEKQTQSLAGHVARFDAGEVRFEGTWITRNELARILDDRQRRDTELGRAEVEKRIFEAAQRDKGLVLHDGRWMTRAEADQVPPEAPTELSEAIAPLGNGDLAGARFAIGNLTDLSARKTGAAKVRTERLLNVVRHLTRAESRLASRAIATTVEEAEAAAHDRNAKEWLKPNAFGTVNSEGVRESREKAAEIRRNSTEETEQARRDLLEQLKEADHVTHDFYELREHRVALTLGRAVSAAALRHFTPGEFRPAFPERSLDAIRDRIRATKNPPPP